MKKKARVATQTPPRPSSPPLEDFAPLSDADRAEIMTRADTRPPCPPTPKPQSESNKISTSGPSDSVFGGPPQAGRPSAGASINGRSPVFGTGYAGSNPAAPAPILSPPAAMTTPPTFH